MSNANISSKYIQLPAAVAEGNLELAEKVLRAYYGDRYISDTRSKKDRTGAWFDDFDPTNSREKYLYEISAEDLISISFLSTPISSTAALEIMYDHKEKIKKLLTQIPPDKPLWEVTEPIDKSWPAWQLEILLCDIHSIGPTRASKLIARKRPKIYPIIDSEIQKVLGKDKEVLVPIYNAMQDERLRNFLDNARNGAGLPESISTLRTLDVLAWMEGKGLTPN